MRHKLALVAVVVGGIFALALWIRERDPPVATIGAHRGSATTDLGASPLDSLVAAGESLYWDAAFDSARVIWLDALERSRKRGNPLAEAKILTWLGLAAYRTGDYAAARRLGEEALALKLELGPGSDLSKSYNALGLLAWNEGRLSDATELFQRSSAAAEAEDDEEGVARAALNLGLVFSDQGEFRRARESLETSLAAGQRLGDALIEGRTLTNLGMLEIQTGDPSAGVATLGEARDKYSASGDVTGELNTLGQLATAYGALGEQRRAFAVLDTALVVARRHGHRSEEASALELLGDLYRQAGDYRRALELYDRARRMNREIGLPIEEGADLAREAVVYAALGDHERARSLALEAAAIHRQADAAFETMTDLLLVAELAHLTGRRSETTRVLEEVRELADRLDARASRVALALTRARIADDAEDSRAVLAILSAAADDLSQGTYAELWEAEALRARASSRLGDLEAATAAGYRAVEAAERVREGFGSAFLRTAFLADRQRAYWDLLDVLLRQERIEDAFELADAARGRVFLERLASSPTSTGDDHAATRTLAEGERLLREIDGLVLRRDAIESLPPEERGPSAETHVASLARRLDEARAAYEELLVRVNERDADASALIGVRRVAFEEVQRALDPGETLLEYVVMPDWVVVFAVNRDRVESFATPISARDLIRRVRMARGLTGRASPEPSPTAVLESLHGVLFEPVTGAATLASARRLVIVADAELGHLPFGALRDPETGRYLVERYAISYLPSAAALPVLGTRPGYSEPVPTGVSVLVPMPESLPASRREGRAIRDAHPGTRVFEGRRAPAERARRELSSERIVHVASHGVLEATTPLFSRIELARGGSGPADDGRLEIHEILRLSIRSPFVFLSGCETEVGPGWSSTFASGDDYAILARAFLYAGARGVVATLWRIDDEGAAEFARRFYAHLSTTNPPEALSRAQRDMIRSANYSAPYYWASYRLAGRG